MRKKKSFELLERLFKHDKTLFNTSEPLMLDWLESPHKELSNLYILENIKNNLKKYNFNTYVLLGMGGSSIGPRIFHALLAPKFSSFHILDTLHPDAIACLLKKINLQHTLFIVASKSGSTLEPWALYKFFWAELIKQGIKNPAEHFMAITDPVSPLEQEAQEQGFLEGAFGDIFIGGRYSALSAFGLLPALLMNIDVKRLLLKIQDTQRAGREGLILGDFLARQAKAGRYELVFYFSPSLKALGWWREQLIAESLGKNNSGIVPIINNKTELRENISMACYIELKGESFESYNNKIPGFFIKIKDLYDLGFELYKWQVAISICGIILNINPFDQPNVEQSKKNARLILDKIISNNILSNIENFENNFLEFLDKARTKNYWALLSFLDDTSENRAYLEKMSLLLATKLLKPFIIQQGPGYLHSTGQLFKGGINEGSFILITGPYKNNFFSDYRNACFKDLSLSQALGDAEAMKEAQRHIIICNFKDISMGFNKVFALIQKF